MSKPKHPRGLADTEAQATLRQEINVRGLSRNERRRTLWKDQNPRCETDPLRDASQETEENEGIVKRVLLRVGTR